MIEFGSHIWFSHAEEVLGLKVDAIIRGGISKYTDEVGWLWTSLADYYLRRGLYEKARDIYEEGMTIVVTVRDFAMIFDSYTQFKESMVATRIDSLNLHDDENKGSNDRRKDENEGSEKSGVGSKLEDDNGQGPRLLVEGLSKKTFVGFWLNDENDIDL
ncbi:hypothetical protein AMTR_s00060p00215630 [Amborella trichopoda]|uniref:Pre-mRNA-splicing factor SYF1 central HAT repeats domain-containing protein n=1 Tax=Amborella trichopoda TaxID=13333 RepID=W1NL44_AMBTC|nr:hypothetical protein AMTR_s00060p00215630 [Amborella trichopoda]